MRDVILIEQVLVLLFKLQKKQKEVQLPLIEYLDHYKKKKVIKQIIYEFSSTKLWDDQEIKWKANYTGRVFDYTRPDVKPLDSVSIQVWAWLFVIWKCVNNLMALLDAEVQKMFAFLKVPFIEWHTVNICCDKTNPLCKLSFLLPYSCPSF